MNLSRQGGYTCRRTFEARALVSKETPPLEVSGGVLGELFGKERELPIISVRARWRFFGFELGAVLGMRVPQPLQADMFAR